MTLKHVLKHFNKTEVQEDRELVIQNDKTSNMSLRGAERRGNLFNKLDCFAYARNDDLCAEHTVKDLLSNRLTILTTLKHKLDCFAFARNDVLCAKHTVKNSFSYSPIHFQESCLYQAEQRHERSERRIPINENVEFSVLE